MNHRHGILLLVLSSMAICFVLAFEFDLPQGVAAPPSPSAVPANVNVVNTPTVRILERNWQYQAVIIPKAFPGTPEWNEFIDRLNGHGQQGWELVNIVESVALMKKSI